MKGVAVTVEFFSTWMVGGVLPYTAGPMADFCQQVKRILRKTIMQKKMDRWSGYRWMFSVMLVVIVVVLIAGRLSAQQSAAGGGGKTIVPRTADDAVTPKLKDPNRHAQFLNRIKEGDIGLLFMGDSITDFWPRVGEYSWLKFAPYHPADFGISGDATENVLWRINNGELDGIHPKVMVLMIGTNNLGHNPADKPEWAAAGVTKIVQTTREKLPDTKILLLGVFPRDTKENPRRDQVAVINSTISKLDDGKMVRYLDIGKAFLDADGEIPKDVMADRLHPTAKGYDLWYEAMEPTLKEMMN